MATLQELGTVRLQLRLGGEDYQKALHAVQGDTGRVIEWDILDRDSNVVTDLPGVVPVLYVRRPDGSAVGSAQGTITGGVISIPVPSSLLAYAGEAEAQVQLIDSAKQWKLHDEKYRLQIEESLEAGAAPGQNLWFSLADLNNAISTVQALEQQYDSDVAAVSTMRAEVKTNRDYVASVYTQMKTVIDAENARATAENERESAESARAGAETARATAWTALKNYWDQSIKPYWDNTIRPTWTTMTNTWNSWVDTWAGWVTAEGARQTNEGARQNQESTRQANETGRVDAESAREAQWATWDTTMQGVIPYASESTPGIVTVRKTTAETATPYRVPTIGDMSDKLGNKVDKITGKGLSENDYTTTEKNKLSGIATGANNYTHPATHPPSIIATDSSNRFVTDAEKTTWNGKASTAVVTTSANGLMPKEDKIALTNISDHFGDRNLLKNSGQKITNDSHLIAQYPLTEPIVSGEWYTIQIKGQLGVGKTSWGIYNSNPQAYETEVFPEHLKDGVYSLSWQARDLPNRANTYIRVYASESSTVVNSTIEWIKLTKGKTALPWTPAPEDYALEHHTHDSVQTTQGNALKFSRLTQAAYNALGTKDPNTLYIIVG